MITRIIPKFPLINALSIQGVSKSVTNHFISKKIEEALDETKNSIENCYTSYRQNVIISASLNIAIVLLIVISYFFFSVNNIIIVIISVMSLLLIARFLYLTIRNIIKIMPHLHKIKIFINDVFLHKSISIAVKERIIIEFWNIYYDNTNKAGRFAHSVASKLRLVKSAENILEEVLDEFNHMIKYFLIKNIIYRATILSACYIIVAFILKPIVFSYIMHTNILNALVYPFTVALPKVIGIFGGRV